MYANNWNHTVKQSGKKSISEKKALSIANSALKQLRNSGAISQAAAAMPAWKASPKQTRGQGPLAALKAEFATLITEAGGLATDIQTASVHSNLMSEFRAAYKAAC